MVEARRDGGAARGRAAAGRWFAPDPGVSAGSATAADLDVAMLRTARGAAAPPRHVVLVLMEKMWPAMLAAILFAVHPILRQFWQ